MSADADPARQAAAIARRFLGDGDGLALRPLGAGLINDTWLVQRGGDAFVLQRINTAVFPDADGIMANLARLQAEVARSSPGAGDAGLRLPRFFGAADGALLLRDDAGGAWRLMEHIGPSRVLTAIDRPAQAAAVGRLLGRFHAVAAGLEPAGLAVTLPGFHDTPAYLAALRAALARQPADDPRVAAAVNRIEARAGLVPVLAQAHASGLLPRRVIHGDPKLDNLLFAADGDEALCLIDLDTVQPGLVHHDIADCLRSCCNRRGEGPGAARAGFDVGIAGAILTAYAEAADGLLGPAEVALLYDAIRLLPLELGIRFLTDHLDGDRYFRVAAHGENLAKAAVQLALVADIEANEAALRGVIARAFG